MKKWTFPVLCVAVLALVLVPSASALFLCQDCPGPTSARCGGSCPPYISGITTCATWFAFNCPILFAPMDASDEEIFLLSLEAQAAVESAKWIEEAEEVTK